MIEKQIQILKQSICEAFERTAFIFLDEAEGKQEIDTSFYANISFTSDFGKGQIVLESSESFLFELSSNLLDTEDHELGQKSLLEMLNICAGHFLTDSFGFECQTHLGIPTSAPPATGMDQFHNCSFLSDSMNPLNVYLEMELKS